jgi:hypothetical protein
MELAQPGPAQALELFEQFLRARGHRLEAMTPREGVDAVLEFFRTQRFSFRGEDWLLFQYGTYDWGAGRYFDFDLTRQLAVEPDEDSPDGAETEVDPEAYEGEGMWQLSLTFKFAPTEELEALGDDGLWCESHSPAALADFESYVSTSAPYRALSDLRADVVELTYEDAG